MGNKQTTPTNTPSGTPRKGKMTDLSSPPASPASRNSSRKNSAATKNKMTNTMSISNDSSTGRSSNSVTNAVGRQSTRSKPHILGNPASPNNGNSSSMSGKDFLSDNNNNNSNNYSSTSSSFPDEPHSAKVFRKSLHMHRKASMDATTTTSAPTLMSSNSTLSSINSNNNNNTYEETPVRDSNAIEMPVMEPSAVAVDELMSDGEMVDGEEGVGSGEQQFKDRSAKIASTLPGSDLDRKAFAALDTKAKNIEYAKKLRELEKKQKEEEEAKLDTTQIHRKQELDAELREHENAKKQHLNKLNSAFKTGNNLKAGPRPVSSRPKEIVNRNLIVGK